MTQNESENDRGPSPAFSDPEATRAGNSYRRQSGLAWAAAVLAALGATAFYTWMLWWVPLVAAFLAMLALYSMRNDPSLTGRRLAVIALAVALVLAAAAPTRFVTRSQHVSGQASRAAVEWLEILRTSQSESFDLEEPRKPNIFRLAKAHQLRLPAGQRQPFDDKLKAFYLDDEMRRNALEEFVKDPVVHTLHTLGSRATIRIFAIESCRQLSDRDVVKAICAVTFLRAGRAESFFVEVLLERTRETETSRASWRVVSYRETMPVSLTGT